MSILPVDQGFEHSASASFASNPQYFDPENIVKLALAGRYNALNSKENPHGGVGQLTTDSRG